MICSFNFKPLFHYISSCFGQSLYLWVFLDRSYSEYISPGTGVFPAEDSPLMPCQGTIEPTRLLNNLNFLFCYMHTQIGLKNSCLPGIPSSVLCRSWMETYLCPIFHLYPSPFLVLTRFVPPNHFLQKEIKN